MLVDYSYSVVDINNIGRVEVCFQGPAFPTSANPIYLAGRPL